MNSPFTELQTCIFIHTFAHKIVAEFSSSWSVLIR